MKARITASQIGYPQFGAFGAFALGKELVEIVCVELEGPIKSVGLTLVRTSSGFYQCS